MERQKRLSFGGRTSGLLMHITSLPGPHGSGDLGAEAYGFVDFLARAGQSWWQMLPVAPPGAGGSPYSATSAQAGSPYLVSLQGLVREGLLKRRDLAGGERSDPERVDFARANAFREERLRRAHARFAGSPGRLKKDYERFCAEQGGWVEDFALYSALKEWYGGRPWFEWGREVVRREPKALAAAAGQLAEDVDYHRFVQFLFDRQWRGLHDYARDMGVGLIGDIPIFVAHDSVDVWCCPKLFKLDKRFMPREVSGAPPDLFSETGQRWNHPQYDWGAHARERFAWWVKRVGGTFRLFDAVRIDHFLGFARVWSIPAKSPTAARGRWVKSPGRALFAAVRKGVGERPIIAEDLGELTAEAAGLRDELGFPGMRVLQFGFGEGGDGYHEPHGFVRNAVAYTGTHDNQTTAGWFKGLDARAKKRVRAYVGEGDVAWGMIRLAMGSVANTAIVPVQDVLGLDDRARMNVPGKAEGNWGWRVRKGVLDGRVAGRLREMVRVFRRGKREE